MSTSERPARRPSGFGCVGDFRPSRPPARCLTPNVSLCAVITDRHRLKRELLRHRGLPAHRAAMHLQEGVEPLRTFGTPQSLANLAALLPAQSVPWREFG